METKLYSYFVTFNKDYYPVVSDVHTVVHTNKKIKTVKDFYKFQSKLSERYFKCQMREETRLAITNINFLAEFSEDEIDDDEFDCGVVDLIDMLND